MVKLLPLLVTMCLVPQESGKKPLLLIYELSARRGDQVKRMVAPTAEKAGFVVKVTTESVEDWLWKQEEPEFDADRIVLMGFSAAGADTLKHALAAHDRLAGVILVAALANAPDLKGIDRELPFYLIYSDADTTAPPGRGEPIRRALEKAKQPVVWKQLNDADHFGVLRDGAAHYVPFAEMAAWCRPELKRAAKANKRDARKIYDAILKKYPGSSFAKIAKKKRR